MCTCFRLKANDKSIVVGRTLEFGIDLKSKLTVFPRGYNFKAIGPDNKPGYTWNGKFGFVGMNAFGLPLACDGLNEKGLYVGELYLPGFAKYQEVPAGEEAKAISQLDVPTLILSSCETVEDAKVVLNDVFVWPYILASLGNAPTPTHYIVDDAEGNSVVFEYVDGKLKTYDNPLGILTNSPNFDWHLTNLRNHVNLSANNIPDLKLDGDDLKPMGQGSGMVGLPGDVTPASRFIRAVALTQSALKVDNAEELTTLAYHILNNFDIPMGFSRDEEGGKTYYDYTSWITLSDLTNKIYYYRSYTNLNYFKVPLAKADFNATDLKTLETSDSSWSTEVS